MTSTNEPTTCPRCNDTGYTADYNGSGDAITYTCPHCAIGARQWQAEEEYYEELEQDRRDAQSEQQTAGYF